MLSLWLPPSPVPPSLQYIKITVLVQLARPCRGLMAALIPHWLLPLSPAHPTHLAAGGPWDGGLAGHSVLTEALSSHSLEAETPIFTSAQCPWQGFAPTALGFPSGCCPEDSQCHTSLGERSVALHSCTCPVAVAGSSVPFPW